MLFEYGIVVFSHTQIGLIVFYCKLIGVSLLYVFSFAGFGLKRYAVTMFDMLYLFIRLCVWFYCGMFIFDLERVFGKKKTEIWNNIAIG